MVGTGQIDIGDPVLSVGVYRGGHFIYRFSLTNGDVYSILGRGGEVIYYKVTWRAARVPKNNLNFLSNNS